jgi:hypothetical protein
MIERIYKTSGVSGIFLVVVLLIASCATVPNKEDLEGALRTTADSYWKLRMEDKYEDSYKMENKQGLPPFEEYRGRAMTMKRIRITSISVKSVSVSDDKGVVELEYSYLLPKLSQPFHQILMDYWGYNNGTWQHMFK